MDDSSGGDEDRLNMDQSGLSTLDFNLTPNGQDSTFGRLLQDEDPLQLPSNDSLDIGFDGPDPTTRPSEASSPPRPFALERLSKPDILTMPLQQADEAIRKLAQAHFALFFQNLKVIQDLQLSNITRADTEITRIKGLLNDKDDEATDCRAKLEQASQALDAADTEQHDADAECAKHEPLRALCQNNEFSSAVRLALTQAEEELERLDQRAQDASEATEAARGEMQSYEDTAQQHQQALDTLRQELRAAEKVRERCKNTGSVLRGSSDEVLSLSLGPRFPHDDIV